MKSRMLRPATVSKIFSTHPPTEARIKAVQKDIQDHLQAKPVYVVETSDFDSVKIRLTAPTIHRKTDEKAPSRPTLRRRPGAGAS